MYTLVPRHVREDMEWMADVGTNAVSIALLEQDLYATKANVDIICREADRVGMEVHAVASRWGGLVAGSPKVPSLFAASHPETWACNKDGTPQMMFGPVCSVHHPETFTFFCDAIDTLTRLWPVKGLIWDELKGLRPDYSLSAKKEMPENADVDWHIDQQAFFFDRVGKHFHSRNPDSRITMFLYGHLKGYTVARCAQIVHITDFGCDGRPWSLANDNLPIITNETATKSLLDQAPYFISEAKKNGKCPMFLIENHSMETECFDIMDRRLPDVLRLGAEHVIYYYYPRNVADPDRQMAIIAKHLKSLKKQV